MLCPVQSPETRNEQTWFVLGISLSCGTLWRGGWFRGEGVRFAKGRLPFLFLCPSGRGYWRSSIHRGRLLSIMALPHPCRLRWGGIRSFFQRWRPCWCLSDRNSGRLRDRGGRGGRSGRRVGAGRRWRRASSRDWDHISLHHLS